MKSRWTVEEARLYALGKLDEERAAELERLAERDDELRETILEHKEIAPTLKKQDDYETSDDWDAALLAALHKVAERPAAAAGQIWRLNSTPLAVLSVSPVIEFLEERQVVAVPLTNRASFAREEDYVFSFPALSAKPVVAHVSLRTNLDADALEIFLGEVGDAERDELLKRLDDIRERLTTPADFETIDNPALDDAERFARRLRRRLESYKPGVFKKGGGTEGERDRFIIREGETVYELTPRAADAPVTLKIPPFPLDAGNREKTLASTPRAEIRLEFADGEFALLVASVGGEPIEIDLATARTDTGLEWSARNVLAQGGTARMDIPNSLGVAFNEGTAELEIRLRKRPQG